MHKKYDLAAVWVVMAAIADDAGSPLITARLPADMLGHRLDADQDKGCADLGILCA
jgi:hypothetical protein